MIKKLLPLLLLILIGCSEPEPINIKLLNNVDGIYYTSENKPYSGKVFRTYSNNSNEIWTEGVLENGIPTTYIVPTDSEKLNLRNGSIYKINNDTPFTGHVYTLYSNGNTMEEGSFLNGQIDQKLILYFSDGQVKSESIYTNGEEKYINKYFENGQVEFMSEGLNDGSIVTKEYYEDGFIKEERTYLENFQNGPFKTYYENEKIKVKGSYLKDELDGDYTLFGKDGSVKEERKYIRGNLNGSWITYNEDGKIKSNSIYLNNKKNGISEYYYQDGQLEEKSNYLNNQKNGLSEVYYGNGQLKFKGYYENKLRKDFETYFFNGKLEKKGKDDGNFILMGYHRKLEIDTRIEYRNGSQYSGKEILELGYENKEVFYIKEYERGKLVQEEFIKFNYDVIVESGLKIQNKKEGIWKGFHSDGTLRYEKNYKNGKMDGLSKDYIDRQLVTEQNFKDNEEDGPYKTYWLNGLPELQVYVEGNYKNGERDGSFKEYKPNGKLKKETTYKNGKLIKTKEY